MYLLYKKPVTYGGSIVSVYATTSIDEDQFHIYRRIFLVAVVAQF